MRLIDSKKALSEMREDRMKELRMIGLYLPQRLDINMIFISRISTKPAL